MSCYYFTMHRTSISTHQKSEMKKMKNYQKQIIKRQLADVLFTLVIYLIIYIVYLSI